MGTDEQGAVVRSWGEEDRAKAAEQRAELEVEKLTAELGGDRRLAALLVADPELRRWFDVKTRALRLEEPLLDTDGAPMLTELRFPERARPSHVADLPTGRGLVLRDYFAVLRALVGIPAAMVEQLGEGDFARAVMLVNYFLQRSRMIGG